MKLGMFLKSRNKQEKSAMLEDTRLLGWGSVSRKKWNWGEVDLVCPG